MDDNQGDGGLIRHNNPAKYGVAISMSVVVRSSFNNIELNQVLG
jgi:hypothetical protein